MPEDTVLLLPEVGHLAALLEEVAMVLILLLVDGGAGDQGGCGRSGRGSGSISFEASDEP